MIATSFNNKTTPSAGCFILLVLMSLFSTINTYRIALLNDIHLNLTYNLQCHFPLCYDLGRYDYDSPAALLDLMFDDLKT